MRHHEDNLKVSLTKAIDVWLDSVSDNTVVLPYVGNITAEAMASAALAVLRGIADAEDYLRREGLLNDGEEGSPE